jgi:hypothetical protein
VPGSAPQALRSGRVRSAHSTGCSWGATHAKTDCYGVCSPLNLACQNLLAGLGALRGTVRVEEGSCWRCGGWELAPERCDRFLTPVRAQWRPEQVAECARWHTVGETLEPCACFHDGVRPAPPAARRANGERAGQQPEHAVRVKAPCEGANGCGMPGGFLRPLPGGAVLAQQPRAHDRIAPLPGITALQCEVVTVQRGLHRGLLPCWSPGPQGAGSSSSPAVRRMPDAIGWGRRTTTSARQTRVGAVFASGGLGERGWGEGAIASRLLVCRSEPSSRWRGTERWPWTWELSWMGTQPAGRGTLQLHLMIGP